MIWFNKKNDSDLKPKRKKKRKKSSRVTPEEHSAGVINSFKGTDMMERVPGSSKPGAAQASHQGIAPKNAVIAPEWRSTRPLEQTKPTTPMLDPPNHSSNGMGYFNQFKGLGDRVIRFLRKRTKL